MRHRFPHPLLLALAAVACNSQPTRAPEPNRVAPTAAASAQHARSAPARYAAALIENVPHVKQKPDFCGEALVESYTRARGKPFGQDQVFALSGMPPARGMGATTRELKVALEQIGFDAGPVWHPVRADRAEEELDGLFAALHRDLVVGIPSIVCMHYDERPGTTEHFRLVLGYDPGKDEVIYHEPAVDRGAYLRMARSRFLALWPLKYRSAEWTVIRLRLAATTLAEPPPLGADKTPADFAQHVMALRPRVPAGFTIVVEPPFVVVGDSSPDAVARFATETVRWAVARLERAYFPRPPQKILDVWLFKDAGSYQMHCRELFGEEPDTPYGYYSPKHRALIMNIATGGGTLVHEIVHPFIEANFPECPAWLNEGLGSLYEQSSSRAGDIIGLTNWRLAGLQEAINEGRVPSFADLTATSSDDFYHQDRGTNYAQARYLMYYLQERGLLHRYYHEVLAHRADDPTGYETLKRVLAEPDMSAFERRWREFVLGLTFP